MGCRAGLVVLVLAAGCRQLLGLNDLPPIDATSMPDVYIPDAGPCQTLGSSCAGPDVRTCSVLGEEPTDMPCDWGCAESGGAHCTELVPAGGGVLPTDLDPDPSVMTITISIANTQITDTGAITSLRAAGTGTISGISFQIRNGIAIYTFDDLLISSNVLLRGTHPIALVALDNLTIQAAGSLDAVGDCLGATPGPGGFAGGPIHANAAGSGGGAGGTGNASDASGGGGGGNGAGGGTGGHSISTLVSAGGTAFGTDDVATLVGGGGGGGGGVNAVGGGGGGGVQLVAEHAIQIYGGINAGGCGGPRGNSTSAAGGGGAGGTILIEGNTVTLAATAMLAANGGGGGGGGGGTVGQPGGLGTARAAGGSCGGGNSGGLGGASGTLVGDPGSNDPQTGCGGGGGTGRIRVNTATGSATNAGAVLSPGFGETASTQGIAATQ